MDQAAIKDFDVVVVGGGPGGYPCAIRLGQLGLKVACVEEAEYGGVCLNWGCVPSKALIANAHLYEKAHAGAEVGIKVSGLELDVPAMQTWKDGIVKKLTTGVRGLLKANKATAVAGTARLISKNTVEVTREDGTKETLRAGKAVVIATGSATIQIPGFEFDGERVIGAKEAVSLKQVPKRLLVIGGGVIGCELGTVYQKFGAELTIVELSPSLLPGVDAECVKVVERKLKKAGAKLHTAVKAEGYSKREDGSLAVKISGEAGTQELECDMILVSVGMRPRSKGLGLEELGVQIDPRGFIQTNDVCQTNVEGIYAIGDVSGAPMLAHKATKEGEVCAEVIAGKRAGKDWVTVPSIIFTDPEIASVGLTEAEAKAQGMEVKVGKFPFAALARAMSIRETDGFTKVVMESASERVVGIQIVGPGATDLISEAALALEMVATASDIGLTVHPHPTLGEALMEASQAALGHAIHIVNR